MIKYRSHRSANSREYQAGCPGAWPQIEETVDDTHRLTSEEVLAGFALINREEHISIREQYKVEFELWEASRKSTDDSDIQTKRTELKAAFDALENVRTKVGDFNIRQLSDFARLEARLLQTILKNASELFER